MHEMALAENVLQLIEEAARQQRFSRVSAVWLEIGELAAVDVEAMRFCFDAVMRGSLAEGARLEVLAVPGTGWCINCKESVRLADALAACPQCGGHPVKVIGGTELRVKELDVTGPGPSRA